MIVRAILMIGIIRSLNYISGESFMAVTQRRQNNSDNQSKKDGKDQELIKSHLTQITRICQNCVPAQYLVNKWTEFDQTLNNFLYCHDLGLELSCHFSQILSQSYGPLLMKEFRFHSMS